MDLKIGLKSMDILSKKHQSIENVGKNENKGFDQVFNNKRNDQNKIRDIDSDKKVDDKKNVKDLKDFKKVKKTKKEKKKPISEEEAIEGEEKIEKLEENIEALLENLSSLISKLEENTLNLEDLDLSFLNLENIEAEELLNALEQFLSEESYFPNDELVQINEMMENLSFFLEDEITKIMKFSKEEPEKLLSEEILNELTSLKNELVQVVNETKTIKEDVLDLNLEDTKEQILIDESENEDLEFNEELSNEDIQNVKGIEEKSIEENIVGEMEDIDVEKNDSDSYTFETIDRTTTKETPKVIENPLPQVEEKEIIEQIVNKAKLIVEDNKQEIRIKLKPEVLGDLILKMEVVKGSILAKIMVDNHRTKELIEANLVQLQEDMKENNLEIKTFEVFVGSNHDFDREEREQFVFNKKQNKIKVRKNEIKEVEIYDDNIMTKNEGTYEHGKLNLFA